MAIQNLRSSQAHRRAIPTLLSAGQICINTNEASPGVFFKDSNGDLVKVGPVHIGTSAPNSSPDSLGAGSLVTGTVYQILTVGSSDFTAVGASANTVGTIFTATGTTTGTGTVSTGVQGNEKGEMWLDTAGGAYDLKIYDGSAWRSQAGEFVNVTGDNMTGNLTLGTNKVILNASNGSATFAGGDFQINETGNANGKVNIDSTSDGGNSAWGLYVKNNDSRAGRPALKLQNVGDANAIEIINAGGTATTSTIASDGSAYFASNVGIGTASPHNNAGTNLHIHGSNTTAELRLTNTTTGAGGNGAVIQQGGNTLYVTNTEAGNIAFENNGSERLRIDSSGRLLVGTTAADQDAPLTVCRTGAGGATPSTISGSTVATFRATGGLSHESRVSILGGSSGASQLNFGDRDDEDVANIRYDHSNNSMQFVTLSAERMRIDAYGRVGIGVTPEAWHSNTNVLRIGAGGALHSQTTNRITELTTNIYSDGSNNRYIHTDFAAQYYQYLGAHVWSRAASGTAGNVATMQESMRIDTSGRVGIGVTNPADQLQVNGSGTTAGDGAIVARFYDSAQSKGLFLGYDSNEVGGTIYGANLLTFQTYNGTSWGERMRIGSNGNVSVGTTTTDQAKLHVENGSFSTIFKVSSAGAQTAYGIYQNSATGFGTTDGYFVGVGTDGTGYVWNYENLGLGFGTNNTERLRIDSSGNVGVGTTSNYDDSVLEVRKTAGGDGVAIRVTNNTTTDSSQAGIIFTNSTADFTSAAIAHKRNDNALIFYNGQTSGGGGFANATERMRIDSSGRLLVGTTIARTDFYSGALSADIQIEDSSYCAYSAYVTNGNAAFIFGRGNPISGSIVGNLSWMADDGTDEVEAARISAQIDGTPGSNSMPGRLVFSTTASGASSTTERMRIDSSGRLLQGKTSSKGSTGANIPTYCTEIASNNPNVLEIANNGTAVNSYSALVLSRSDSSSVNGHVAIDSGDKIGEVAFIGADGSDRFNTGAAIAAIAQADFTANNCPTHLTFSTNSGSAVASERMRIDSSGNVGIGTTSPNFAQFGSDTGGLAVEDVLGNTGIKIGNGTNHNYLVAAGNNFYQSHYGSGSMIFGVGSSGNERMRINSAGSLQVATSTNSSFPDRLITAGDHTRQSSYIDIRSSLVGGLLFADGTSGTAAYRGQVEYNHSDDSMRLWTGAGERLRIDSIGRVGIGTSSMGADLAIGSFDGNEGIILQSSTSGSGYLYFADGGSGANTYRGFIQYNHGSADNLQIGTGSVERMRISSQGATWAAVNQSSITTFGQTVHYHGFAQGNNQNWVAGFQHNSTSGGYGVLINFNNAPNNTSSIFLQCQDTVGSKAIIYSNGGLANVQSNNANLCDEREKKNIEPLDSTWGCLKNWELKKFHYNEDADTDDKRYGVIAQQVEEHCPEVLTDWIKQKAEDAVLDDDGNVVTPAKEEILRKGVKEQQMMWMAIKALQEAQARIETLEAEVAALKAG